jgi:hypothetical protein
MKLFRFPWFGSIESLMTCTLIISRNKDNNSLGSLAINTMLSGTLTTSYHSVMVLLRRLLLIPRREINRIQK